MYLNKMFLTENIAVTKKIIDNIIQDQYTNTKVIRFTNYNVFRFPYIIKAMWRHKALWNIQKWSTFFTNIVFPFTL